MSYIQIPQEKTIQLSQSTKEPIGTKAKEEIKAGVHKPLEPVKFRSIFAPTRERKSSELLREPRQAQPAKLTSSETSGQKEKQTEIDDISREKEAQVMKPKALQMKFQKVHPHDYASETVQLMPTQYNFQGPLIENLKNSLNPLNENRLNLVGENYDESENRRDREKKHSEKYSGSSNYWQGEEFITKEKDTTIQEDSPTVVPPPTTNLDNKLFADSLKASFQQLRLLPSIQIGAEQINQKLMKNIEKLKSGDKSNVDESFHLLFDEWRKVKNFQNIVDDFDSLEEPAVTENDSENLWQKFAIVFKSYYHGLKTSKLLSESELSMWESINNNLPENISIPEDEDVVASISNYKGIVDELLNQKVVNISDAIHKVANNYSQKTGVWKIENNYLKNIQQKYTEDQIKYNPVNEKQFNLHLLLNNELTSSSSELMELELIKLLQDELQEDALEAAQNKEPEIAKIRAKKIQGALKTDQLNVVGENHDESGERRKEEKIYAAIFSGSPNYWLEHEFRFREQEPHEEVQSQENDKRPFADPTHLGFFDHIRRVYRSAKNIFSGSPNQMKKLDEEVQPQENDKRQFADPPDLRFFDRIWLLYSLAKDITKDITISKTENMDLLKAGLELIDYLLNNPIYSLDSGKYRFELEQEEKKKFMDLVPQIKDIAVTWQDAYEHYYQGIPNQADKDKYPQPETMRQKYILWATEGQKVLTANSNPQENCIASLNILITAIKQKGLLSKRGLSDKSLEGNDVPIKTLAGIETKERSNEINMMRSDQMHEAANNRYKTKGVWKIGEQHVIDIDTKYPEDQINYNLVHRDVFNDDMKFGLNFAIMLVLGKSEDMRTLKENKFGASK